MLRSGWFARFRWIFLLIACLVLAAGAYEWVTSLVNSFYTYQSPIHLTPPLPGPALGKPATHRLVFVLVDALRYDTSLNVDVMPNLNRLRTAGASARMHSQPPSFSQPGYTTLLTGGWPYLNDGPVFNIAYADVPTWTQDNLVSAAHRTGLKTALSGYNWFEKLVPQADVDAHFYTPGEDAKADREVVDAALPWLKSGAYQLVFIHIDQVDYAGHHQGGPRSPNWATAAQRSDGLIGEVLATLDLSQDTILVVSDHGQIDAGGHGGSDPITLVEPFVLAGAGVKPGQYGEIQMVEVAPTLAALLGTNLPASSQGTARTDMLQLDPATLTNLQKEQSQQQADLTADYNAAIGRPGSTSIEAARSSRLSSERWPRAILVLALLLAPIWFALRRRSPKLPWLLAGGLFYVLVFNLRYGILDAKAYSFSAILSPTDLVLYSAGTCAMALIAAWLLAAWLLKAWRFNPREAAETSLWLVLVTIYLLFIPILWSYLLNGVKLTWTVPEMSSTFLCLLSLVQVASIAVVGSLLTGISALVLAIPGLSARDRMGTAIVNGKK
jgi:hypothetical protein